MRSHWRAPSTPGMPLSPLSVRGDHSLACRLLTLSSPCRGPLSVKSTQGVRRYVSTRRLTPDEEQQPRSPQSPGAVPCSPHPDHPRVHREPTGNTCFFLLTCGMLTVVGGPAVHISESWCNFCFFLINYINDQYTQTFDKFCHVLVKRTLPYYC